MSGQNQTRRRAPSGAYRCPETVQKVIKSPDPHEPDQAEISLPDAEPLYQEIRLENKLKDEAGDEVCLKPGASVDVTIEAEAKDTKKKEK
jgi:hypothetical protein